MYRINLKTVDALVQQAIGDVAQRVQECTQQHVGHTHTTLNGMFPAVPTAQQAARPLELIEKWLQFEALDRHIVSPTDIDTNANNNGNKISNAIKNIANYTHIC